jgi:signal transduction histidine kinase
MKTIIKHPLLHLFIGIICFLLIPFNSFLTNTNVDINHLNNNLHKKEALATQLISDLSQQNNSEALFLFSKKYVPLVKQQGISLFVIENNQVTFWTNRSINFSYSLADFKNKNGFVQLKNGWYQYLLKQQNNKTYLALILIKNKYNIKNKYLKNEFHPSFDISANAEIFENSTHIKTENIYALDGSYLFSLKISNNTESLIPTNNWIIVILFFLGYFFSISFISKQSRKIAALRNYTAVIVIGFIIVSRLLLLDHPIFKPLYNLEIFSPTIFAQSMFLPSLGDLLLSIVLFSVIIYYFSKAIKKINPNNKIVFFGLVIITALLSLVLADLIKGLITNSKINFDINYLLDLNTYSFVGIGAITLSFISLILLIKITINHFLNQAYHRFNLISIYWIINLLMVIIGHFFLEINAFLTSWVLLTVLAFSFKTTAKTSFYRSVFLVLIIASTTSYGFIHLGKEKEQINKEFIVKKLAKERDPVAEYLFNELKEKMEQDSLVIHNIDNYWENKTMIDKHIINRYFGGYWSKYDINVSTSCQENDTILIEPDNINVNCLQFFQNKIEKEAVDAFNLNETLNFLYSGNGISSYLARLKITNTDTINNNTWYLFIEFFPKIFSKTEGYPELLLNEKDISSTINTNQYSFAKYKDGKLIDNAGKFNYSLELSDDYKYNKEGFFKTTFNSAYHIIYQSDKNNTIILSSPQKTIFNYITTFSYFFIITSILVLIVGIIYRIAPFNWQIALTDFSTKIQLFVIVSIFISFILFAWGTSYYIKKQYLEKNKTQLTEKVQSVLIELEQKLGSKTELNDTFYDEMTYYLVKFSNVFYSDINLYNVNGELLASSRPEIFDRGLISKQMDPDAFKEMNSYKKSTFTHNENIGGLNYLSTYVPFRNNKNKILAYLNLPYFSKQNELENELSSFYTSLINIYGLLFLITAIIAVFFANYISEPVRIIKNKIGALQLGKSYDLIEWQSNDEIGALVSEYNKKVLELEKNAKLLVKSERESAWREMAKQVAHEIKNPLTPMKLSIQHLQRLAKDDSDNLNERIEKTTKTLIEQIDTLTKIADEFSSFAKMPKTNEEKINLLPIIETTIDLFNEEDVYIELNSTAKELYIVADKDEISRVFTNLIKNSIQAIPENIKGKIDVIITQQESSILIEIKDNGSGISKELQDKIFVPNFTTKTTGMGLGLAMVKKIVENSNGEIWFETKENVGSSFFIQFPIT